MGRGTRPRQRWLGLDDGHRQGQVRPKVCEGKQGQVTGGGSPAVNKQGQVTGGEQGQATGVDRDRSAATSAGSRQGRFGRRPGTGDGRQGRGNSWQARSERRDVEPGLTRPFAAGGTGRTHDHRVSGYRST